ncbi:hypothetical protein AT959_19920 [Dechloromonas denitrificans]|uniref:Uncharacterized protein n=1 Tax=Dechloromonas denitrificans TaxID=281362 RepID=A0A133XDS1_9RHOO|nr:hypothetical protein [Dechloromonas denitrificans]KXB29083.1 hypothetical protein AT959_19920 [Dechloromonas denitrificans]
MDSTSADQGMLTVLVERLEKQRLPRALALKEKVDRGETLSDYDISFLEEVFTDSTNIKPMIERHPEYQLLAGKVTSLYREITEKALANQQQSDQA